MSVFKHIPIQNVEIQATGDVGKKRSRFFSVYNFEFYEFYFICGLTRGAAVALRKLLRAFHSLES
jgi:hypothetical protein